MKKIITFSFMICFIFITTNASAAQGIVNRWISAMMQSGQGLNSLITPDFEYTNYSFDNKRRLARAQKGDIQFFAKTSKPVEINVEETIPSYEGGQIVVLNAVAETGLYREWEIRLFVRSGRVAKVTEIAKEGVLEGNPPGCTETAYKRDQIVTLQGNPSGFKGPKTIKLYTLRRDTDAWAFAKPEAEEKIFSRCSPRPDTYIIDSEVVVLNGQGQIERANTVAKKQKREKDETGQGKVFISEDGINFPGRLFPIGKGLDGLLLTFSSDHGKRITYPTKLNVWKGSGWKSIWGFEAGHSSSSATFASGGGDAVWSIRSATDAAGNPAIAASLEINNDDKYSCPVGTTIMFTKSGPGFKRSKGNVPSGCN